MRKEEGWSLSRRTLTVCIITLEGKDGTTGKGKIKKRQKSHT